MEDSSQIIRFLVFLVVAMLPIALAAGVVAFLKFSHEKYENPLTQAMRRPPGAQLGRELGMEQMNVGFSMLYITLGVFYPLAYYLVQVYWFEYPEMLSLKVSLVITAFGIIGYGVKELVRCWKRIRILRLAYECELAVGQELDQLMLKGYQVFHDVPAEGFNVDHVLVGPNGVFAIETKGRSKRVGTGKDGKADFNVSYENGVLKFPGWSERAPIEQAVSQAIWVSSWLSRAAGFAVHAKPVVVLPGWYVHFKERPSVPVIASGMIKKNFFERQQNQILSSQQILQIVYQIEQKVRDLSPGDIVRPLPA